MREYVVMIGGLPHTMQMSEEMAKRWDAKPAEPKTKQRQPANKARRPRNKSEE